MVIGLNALLANYNRHFGYRVATEIARFVGLAVQQTGGASETLWAALDIALLEKVLPKFHGTQEELDEPLRSVFAFAIAGKPNGPLLSWNDLQGQCCGRRRESA